MYHFQMSPVLIGVIENMAAVRQMHLNAHLNQQASLLHANNRGRSPCMRSTQHRRSKYSGSKVLNVFL